MACAHRPGGRMATSCRHSGTHPGKGDHRDAYHDKARQRCTRGGKDSNHQLPRTRQDNHLRAKKQPPIGEEFLGKVPLSMRWTLRNACIDRPVDLFATASEKVRPAHVCAGQQCQMRVGHRPTASDLWWPGSRPCPMCQMWCVRSHEVLCQSCEVYMSGSAAEGAGADCA